MTDLGLAKKSSGMSVLAMASATAAEATAKEKSAKQRTDEVKKPALPAKNGKKPGSGLLTG
jgi:hypothetical protein